MIGALCAAAACSKKATDSPDAMTAADAASIADAAESPDAKPDATIDPPDAAPSCTYGATPDGAAHLLASYKLAPTSMKVVDPLLKDADLDAAMAAGAQTVTAPGIGSGLEYVTGSGCPGSFVMITDRGPNGDHTPDGKFFPMPAFTPTIVRVHLVADASAPAIALDGVMPLLDRDGAPTTGLPNTADDDVAYTATSGGAVIPDNQNGLDTEDIRKLPGGDLLICDEHSPSVAVIDGATGKVKIRYIPTSKALPDAKTEVSAILPGGLSNRRVNKGFEGLALSSDGKTAYATLQAPMGDDGNAKYKTSRIIRVVRLDVTDPMAAKVTGDFLVKLDAAATFPSGTKQKDVLVSSATWVAADRLLLDERAKGETRLVTVDLAAAADIRGKQDEDTLVWEDVNTDLGALGVTPAAPAQVFSTKDLPAVAFPDKIEGLAIIDASTVALANDNDFGIADINDASRVWVIQLAAALH